MGRDERAENAKQGRLSATIRAEESKEFAFADGETDTVQRGALAVAVRERVNGDDGFIHGGKHWVFWERELDRFRLVLADFDGLGLISQFLLPAFNWVFAAREIV